MTVAISVSTADAVPLVAPFKLSAKTGHDKASVTITVSPIGAVYAYKIKRGGTAITNGATVAAGAIAGRAVAGVDALAAAGVGAVTGLAVAGVDRPAGLAVGAITGLVRTGMVRTADATARAFAKSFATPAFGGGADGDYPMRVYVYRAGVFE
jgi:hypothetical protein